MTDRHQLDEHESPVIDDVFITRASDQGVLRAFSANIRLLDLMETDVRMGCVRGLIGWRIEEEDLWEAADAVSADAAVLARPAEEIRDWLYESEDVVVDTVVMIEMLRLEPQFRGQRLTNKIVDELVEVLALDPETTLIVGQPEPQKEEGGPLPDGPERDAALVRLRRASEEQGRKRWRDSPVWWKLVGSEQEGEER